METFLSSMGSMWNGVCFGIGMMLGIGLTAMWTRRASKSSDDRLFDQWNIRNATAVEEVAQSDRIASALEAIADVARRNERGNAWRDAK